MKAQVESAVFSVLIIVVVMGSGIAMGQLIPGLWSLPVNILIGALEGWATIYLLKRRWEKKRNERSA
jgi:hypothetical protein